MILCLIKHTRLIRNHHAFTITEMMMAVAFSLVLMTGVYSFYIAASQSSAYGISGQTLQDAADTILNKIIEGKAETLVTSGLPSTVVYRLSTSSSFYIPNGNPSTVYYCQDAPCTAADTTARWYYLNNQNVVYHHPTLCTVTGTGTVCTYADEIVYQAPAGSTISLRFSYAQYNNQTLPNVIEIDIALTQNPSAALRSTNSGSASTFVLLRGHS